MPQPLHFAPLDSRDASRIARLQRRLFARELTEPAPYIRQILANTEKHLVCNLSFGLFDGRRMVGYLFAWVETDSAFHRRAEEVVYIKEIGLLPGYEHQLAPLFLKLFEQWLAFCPGIPVEAHALADSLAEWRRLVRLFRHYGLELSSREESATPGRPPYRIMRLDIAGSPERLRQRPKGLPKERWKYRDDISVAVVRDPAQWLSLREQWAGLLAETPDSNVFQAFDYLWEWWKYCGTWKQLRIIVVYREETVIGIAPLMLEHFPVFGRVVRKLLFITAPMEMNRPKFLFGRNSATCLPVLLAYLRAHANEWDVMDIDEQLDDGQAAALRAHFREAGCLVAQSETLCPYIDIAASWNDFLKQLSRRMRSNVNRMRRHIEKAGKFGIRTVTDAVGLEQAFNDYGDIEQRSWKAASNLDIGSNRAHYYFYEALMRSFGESGKMQMRLLDLDDLPVAATFGIVHDGAFQSLKIAHDQVYDRLSPGTVLESYELEELHSSEIGRYEFMGSFLANKLRWTSTVLATINIHVYQSQPRLRLFFFVFFVFKRRVKTLLKKSGQFERVDRFLGRFRNNPFPRY